MYYTLRNCGMLVALMFFFGIVAIPAQAQDEPAPGLTTTPEDSVDAEAVRLRDTMKSLAQRNAWSGVERNFQDLVELQVPLENKDYWLAAMASRTRGDAATTLERIGKVCWNRTEEWAEEACATKATMEASYGQVTIMVERPYQNSHLIPAVPPFVPHDRHAIEYFGAQLLEHGEYTGLLPHGDYTVNATTFTVAGTTVDTQTMVIPRQRDPTISLHTMLGAGVPGLTPSGQLALRFASNLPGRRLAGGLWASTMMHAGPSETTTQFSWYAGGFMGVDIVRSQLKNSQLSLQLDAGILAGKGTHHTTCTVIGYNQVRCGAEGSIPGLLSGWSFIGQTNLALVLETGNGLRFGLFSTARGGVVMINEEEATTYLVAGENEQYSLEMSKRSPVSGSFITGVLIGVGF